MTHKIQIFVAGDDAERPGRIHEVRELDDPTLAPSDPGEGEQLLELEVTPEELARAKSGHWAFIVGRGFVELPFKAMRLGADDVLEEVVELQSSAHLTARDIDLRPHGGDCDAAPGRYRWDREARTLVPLKPTQARPPAGVDLERALADFWRDLAAAGIKLPESTAAWLKQQTKEGG